MRQRTLTRYLVSEILPPFFFGLLVFTFVLLVARIIKLIELVVTRGVPLLQIAKLFALIFPTFLEMTVPMALLLAIFLGLGRLSNDHELLAFKASGISPLQILRPIALVAVVIALVTLALTTAARPAAHLALKKELYKIAKTRIGTALREKIFNDDFPNLLIYVEEVVPPGNTVQGVLIIDRRNPDREDIIFGKVALLVSNEVDNTMGLKLFDGTIYEKESKQPAFSRTDFNIYDFKLDLDELLGTAQKKGRGPNEMSLRRLLKAIRLKKENGVKATPEIMELHQRFSFAFAPLVFGLLGVALVMIPKSSRANRSWGLALCLFWFVIYYVLLSLGKALGEREFLPPVLALWLPNLVVGTIAVHFFTKALRDSPLFLQGKLDETVSFFNRVWTRRRS